VSRTARDRELCVRARKHLRRRSTIRRGPLPAFLCIAAGCLVEEPGDPTFGDTGTGETGGATISGGTAADTGSGADSTGAGSDAGACVDAAGEFDELIDWSQASNPGIFRDFVATHVVHAPPVVGGLTRDPATARLMMMGGYDDQHLWDPLTGTFTSSIAMRLADVDLWCSGHTITPHGSLFFAGGGGGNPDDAIATAFRFDHLVANDGTWTTLASMNYPRWYPTLTTLADGRVLAFGGLPATVCDDANDQMACAAMQGCTWGNDECTEESGYGNLVQQTAEIYDPDANTWTAVAPSDFLPPLYPLMFLLPDGNVFYAGGENGSGAADTFNNLTQGRVLILNAGAPQWSARIYPAFLAGGSAVMYRPGKIMKSGGNGTPTSRTVFIELEFGDDYPLFEPNGVPDYLDLDWPWEELADNAGDMLEPRHFHQLTMLPDGRVAATGGNWLGNDSSGESPENSCFTTLACDASVREINQILCDEQTPCPCGLDCSEINEDADHDGDSSTPPVRTCNPANNACYAQHAAEIWDPDTHLWSPCETTPPAVEDSPRMYHSSAALLGDGGVISMGGGKGRGGLAEQYNAQIFRPPYGAGDAPTITLQQQSVTYGSAFVVEHGNPGDVSIAGFSLVRLGSVTHSFDMEQRFVPVTALPPAGNLWTVEAPDTGGIAPPGWYMLFAVGENGVPSQGQYLQLTGEGTVEWICASGSGLTITERGCLPSAGPTCGTAGVNVTLLPPSLGGGLRGWAVHTPPGRVADPQNPTSAELAIVRGQCQVACAMEWQNEPGVTTTCTSATAFATPTTRPETSPTTLATLTDDVAHGEGVFPGTALSCELESTCCAAFDEAVCAAKSVRPTPSATVLGRGEAYRVPWKTTTSSLQLTTNMGTWSRSLSGSAGFSPCRDGNATAACPFYLGSLTASTTGSLTPTAMCSDGSVVTVPLSAVQIALEQPTIGVARQGTTERGFPAGGLVLETRVTIAGQVHTRRQLNNAVVKGTQNGATLALNNLDSTLTLPCGSGTTTLTARVNLNSNPASGSPPTATITVPSQVTCGVPRSLTATVSDPNNDIVSTRWLVNGVLLASSVSSVTFTGSRELAVRVRDARGATTTTKKVISCL